MKELTVEKALLYFFLFLLVFMIIFIKILGSTNLPINIEKRGYCERVYGNEWKYNKNNENCYAWLNSSKQEHSFTEEEFREICPRHNFISTRFYGKCFF